MPHPVEHAVGIYIGLMLLACVVAIGSKLISKLPYTIFLTLVGLGIGLFHWGPAISETGFSHELIFFVFLPPLLFQGAMHMELNRLLRQFWPVFSFAVPGVVVSTVLVGLVVYYFGGITAFMVALLFGALISPTDPVSVLALFKEASAPEDLRVLVEGESLFNDATGVVLFSIILEAVMHGGGLSISDALIKFVLVSGGGLVLGAVLGLLAFLVLRKLNDPLLENAICLTLAYGSFWLGEVMHLSGVIAAVMAGLLVGNHGRRLAMCPETVKTVETFFESIEFLLNSLLFILIGLELKEATANIPANPLLLLGVAIVAMLTGRAAVAYPFYWALNLAGTKRPKRWKHILFWGGLRGSIPVALLLQLPADGPLAPWRNSLLLAGFGCVFFSMVVQGITMKPLLKRLDIAGD